MNENRRILIVDDQDDLRKQLSRLLTQFDSKSETSSLIQKMRRITGSKEAAATKDPIKYEIAAVSQGKKAYEMVKDSFSRSEPYALMFLDMRMPPGWNGLETAQRIRSIDKEIQIVVMTAYADYEQHEIAERVGDPEKLLYLKKPFHPEEIRQLALSLTENWNINRREKERLILTNRLLRENTFLTHGNYANISDVYKCVLDAFLSFLDAESGIIGRRENDNITVCAAATTRDERLVKKIGSTHNSEPITDEQDGSAYLPLQADNFDGFIYIACKSITFPYDQLNPFLEILAETAREVLQIAFLINQSNDRKVVAAIGDAIHRVVTALQASRDRINAEVNTESTQTELFRDVLDYTDNALTLSEGIENYCRGHIKSDTRMPHSVSQLIDEAIEAERKAIRKSGAHVESTVAPRVSIKCDGNRMVRCLQELLANAVAARRPDSSHHIVRITAEYADDNESRLRLTIADTGKGLDAETMEQVFDPFFTRADRNGLGATIAKQVVENHGGEISCTANADSGATVEILLPVE
jgi:signal transduction histidine kinase/DNA-binding response OmpR family regulator